MSLWIVDGGMMELPVVARVEDWKEGSYIEIVGSDDGAKWNDVPIRYVAERTCRDTGRYCFTCSECGWIANEPHHILGGFWPEFCPNCGRRVVAGDA